MRNIIYGYQLLHENVVFPYSTADDAEKDAIRALEQSKEATTAYIGEVYVFKLEEYLDGEIFSNVLYDIHEYARWNFTDEFSRVITESVPHDFRNRLTDALNQAILKFNEENGNPLHDGEVVMTDMLYEVGVSSSSVASRS